MRERGHLLDRLTQLWVKVTGRRIALADHPWLDGPVGPVERIGEQFFAELADGHRLRARDAGPGHGLMPSFDALRCPGFDPRDVAEPIRRFYEHTSSYRLDVWSQWSGPFRPFGWALARLFSRRLEQLNVPLTPLSTAAGMSSSIVQLEDPASGSFRYTAWVRRNKQSGETIFAAGYSITPLPGHGRVVKVVFPLPNGNATVLLRPIALEDGSLLLQSRGKRFGDPGFVFVVAGTRGKSWVRYVSTFHETIRVFVDEAGEVRTDHDFHIWGRRFLRLHYRMLAAA